MRNGRRPLSFSSERTLWSFFPVDKRYLFEQGNTQDLQNGIKTWLEFVLLLDDGDDHVHADGDPDLRFNGIWKVPEKILYFQVLFYPFEEQFDFPSVSRKPLR